jgi:hypothetical protein
MVAILRTSLVFLAAVGAAHASGATGIWSGAVASPKDKKSDKQDVAFQFKEDGNALTGVMFGEEFDLPLEDLKIEDGRISFSVTSTNYYSGERRTLAYSGNFTGRAMRLVREHKDGKDTASRQTVSLARID